MAHSDFSDIDAKLAEPTAVRDSLRAAPAAGCDNLRLHHDRRGRSGL
ncbi:hypothetical protein K7711_01280 [Nocardia sp. CA2R105]|nr:hypothetical protein [Nocardia coffeae]MBY8855101.1 hypothetical protein [Nocardia coffeae]